jgi:hypothetical protein
MALETAQGVATSPDAAGWKRDVATWKRAAVQRQGRGKG